MKHEKIEIVAFQCPGEGSLKIIDYIRSLKQSKDYKSNASHCIYSGDNDLLLLGIATHELYVTLLQEVRMTIEGVVFDLRVSLMICMISHQFCDFIWKLAKEGRFSPQYSVFGRHKASI